MEVDRSRVGGIGRGRIYLHVHAPSECVHRQIMDNL